MLWEWHSHIIPGDSETCKVFPGKFMPDVSAWDVQMPDVCMWSFNHMHMVCGSMAGQARHPWSSAGLLEFQLIHASDSASLFWLKASPEHLNNSRTSKLYFRHCNIIPKSTHGYGTSTLCCISQGASSKIVSESKDESLWMKVLSGGPGTKAVAVPGASTLGLFGDFLQWQDSTGHCTKNTGIILIFYLKVSSSKIILNSQ